MLVTLFNVYAGQVDPVIIQENFDSDDSDNSDFQLSDSDGESSRPADFADDELEFVSFIDHG